MTFAPGSDGGITVVQYTATCASSDGGPQGTATSFEFVGPIVVYGLTNSKTYWCTVNATTAQGQSAPSAASNLVTVGAPGRPTKPGVSRIGAGHLKVSFTNPASNGAPITRFKAVCRSANGGISRGKTDAASPLGVKRLTSGKIYTCTVTATNSRGTGPASTASKAVRA
ncbi:MAG: fibronectin type III domain-containing protein [Acidimicrobiia bacterium]